MRSRTLWISLVSVVVLLVCAVVGGWVWIHGYLRSEAFRWLVSTKTGAILKAEATYGPLQWSGSSIHSDGLTATGLPGSPLQELRADQIRADVNFRAIFDGAWQVTTAEVIHLEATLRPGQKAETGQDDVPAPASRGFSGLLPKRFELSELLIAQTDLTMLGANGAPTLSMKQSAVRAEPDGKGWRINGAGGTLDIPRMPQLAIGDFRSRTQGGAFFLTDAHLRLGDTGKISASGEFDKESRLELKWESVDVSKLLDASWKRRLSGLASGDAKMSWTTGGPAAGTATGKFYLTDGKLENVPLFEQVAAFTSTPQFRRMPLQQVSGDYDIRHGKILITNFVGESKGLTRVEGECQIKPDGSLAGTFQVGVTPQTLQWLPGSREKVFTEARDGYLWTPVRVSGSMANLHEDLSSRLAAAMGEELIDRGENAIKNTPDTMKQGVDGVLQLLTPLLK